MTSPRCCYRLQLVVTGSAQVCLPVGALLAHGAAGSQLVTAPALLPVPASSLPAPSQLPALHPEDSVAVSVNGVLLNGRLNINTRPRGKWHSWPGGSGAQPLFPPPWSPKASLGSQRAPCSKHHHRPFVSQVPGSLMTAPQSRSCRGGTTSRPSSHGSIERTGATCDRGGGFPWKEPGS